MSQNALNPVQFRQKRLRHVSMLKLKNLQIKANNFFVWFTVHLDAKSGAIYFGDKIENDRNPIWKLKNLNKFPQKNFILRIWYSDRSIANSNSRLKLLLQADIDLDHFIYLGDVNLNYSSNKFSNFIIFEIFDNLVFCEPIDEKLPLKNQNTYKSYSNPRLESLYRFTKLKMELEQKSFKIELYKMNLESIKQSILELKESDRILNESILIYKKSIENIQLKYQEQKEFIKNYRKKSDNIVRDQIQVEKGVKIRQQELVSDLSEIFCIKKNKDNLNCILSVCLDLSKKYEETKDNEMNVALGFFVQALEMLSFILSVPLRYPVVFRSSKSVIVEFVENSNIREYALYRTTNGFESNFIYALKLLETNVIQLRFLLDPKHDFKKIEDILTHLKWMFDYLIFFAIFNCTAKRLK
ncbi:UV radiation resistance-associated protein [Brachionus plicatilis]|uniref:UV radiation resistance-associated protein n=1 Tax=Brachionus plicatilis TaxID=10195 RepID=A0A3M7RAU5_BRAPC|nr:UV radiation resistance-associated protein [Brachionus plicatilis]